VMLTRRSRIVRPKESFMVVALLMAGTRMPKSD